MTAALNVVAPGLMTTVQDLGRPGYQRIGVPMSGALDHVSLRAANLLAGNAPGLGALEIAYQGPTLAIAADSVRVAAAGANAPIEIVASDGSGSRRLAVLESARLVRGERIKIGALSGGPMLYLAVEGGFDIAPVMGSQSTLMRAAIGGYQGRPLQAGDELALRQATAEKREEVMLPPLPLDVPKRLRVMWGPQDDYFTDEARRTLMQSTYTISPAADRMGMRLDGPHLTHAKGYNIISDGIAPGSIQVPGNGQPIILLADRQTTGGYPKIATVISADLPALGRLMPGATLGFRAVDIDEAEAAARQLAADIDALTGLIAPVRREPVIDTAKLLAENLVSGAIDAREERSSG